MAYVVGVPKREPCQKCSMPVFLAERLTFGKHVYHRTCLKCARCNAQLSLGSFYETEIDGIYCCETCPDEEDLKTVQSTNLSIEDDDTIDVATAHSSIADRLAFFEAVKSSENPLLQKSVSDEEKSQSLNRMNESTTPYKINSALSSFMSGTITDEVHDSISVVNKIKTNSNTSDESDSDDDDETSTEILPPELPKSLPPQTQSQLQSGSHLGSQLNVDNSEHISDLEQQPLDAQSLRLSPVNTQIVNNQICPNKSDVVDSTTAINLTSEQPLLEQKISHSYKSSVVLSLTSPSPTPQPSASANTNDDLKLNKNNDNNIVTKDTYDNDATTRTKINETENLTNQFELIDDKNYVQLSVALKEPNKNDVAVVDETFGTDKVTTNRLSVVRARLHQFEVIANDSADNVNKNNHNLSGNSSSNNCKIDSPIITYEKRENIDVSVANEKITHDDQRDLKIEDNNEIVEVTSAIINEVPKTIDSSDLNNINEINEIIDDNPEENIELIDPLEEDKVEQSPISISKSPKKSEKIYPDDLNPFDENEEDEGEENKDSEIVKTPVVPAPRKSTNATPTKSPIVDLNQSLNPFDSSDDEIELNKKVKPPRPPPPKNISRNPFGSESDDGEEVIETPSNVSKSLSKRTPIPTPRIITSSQNPTPEPTPRLSTKQFNATTPLNNTDDYYGSSASLGSPYTPSLRRDSDARGSNNSLTSSNGTIRSRKSKKAPAPPPPTSSSSVKELFPSTETASSSRKTTPNSSTSTTPSQQRKKRPAPAPPKPIRLDPSSTLNKSDISSKNLDSYPLQSNIDKLSDEEKALLEGKVFPLEDRNTGQLTDDNDGFKSRRLIPLDTRIIDDEDVNHLKDIQQNEQNNVVYRRKIFASTISSPVETEKSIVPHDRQLLKMKDNKESQNRNRQSQLSLGTDEVDPFYNKSSHGKWKRRKGPAPSLPIPPRKIVQMLPLQEIRYELDIIEVQQQGLEKQGVILEQMIRERCEGKNGELDGDGGSNSTPNSKEVEDLILQLFELVNEKNELFRRQAELMYLRRQHRLEQEQADLEYEIRVLMAQPERNKTDTDKAREETLIARMVEVVQLRNEVIECLEMDRLREAEEDLSIKQRLELHTSRRTHEHSGDSSAKLSKKEKKKQKETKKLFKSKKLDADKDNDESELSVDSTKNKKKKKKFLFSI